MASYPYRCPECKTEVVLRQRVTQTKRKCSYCGTPITTAEIDRQEQEKIKEKIFGFLIFVGIVIIILRPQLLILAISIGIIWLGIKIIIWLDMKVGKNKNKKPPLFRGFLKGVYDCSNLTQPDDGRDDKNSIETILSKLYGEPIDIVAWSQDEDNAETKNTYILREIRRGYYLEMLIVFNEDDITSVSHRILHSFLPLLDHCYEKTWQKFTKKANAEDWLAFDQLMLNTISLRSARVFFAGSQEIGTDVAEKALERFGCYYPDEDMLPVLVFEYFDYQLRLFIPSSKGKFASECQVGDAIDSSQSCFSSLKKAQEFLDQRLSYYIQES
jgi:uncharacterized protein (DUF983 family)